MSLFLLFVIRANDGWKIVEITLFGYIKHCTNKKGMDDHHHLHQAVNSTECIHRGTRYKSLVVYKKTCTTHLQDTSFLQNIPLNCARVMPSSTGHGQMLEKTLTSVLAHCKTINLPYVVFPAWLSSVNH